MADKKITKHAASYIANAFKKHCQDCSMFRDPHSCTLVMGTIDPHGHCKYWESEKEALNA